MADIIASKKAVMTIATIQTDGEIANEIANLRQLHTAARDSDRMSNEAVDRAPGIQSKIDELVEQSVDTLVTFTFKSIGRFNYDELVKNNEPSDEEKKGGADFSADTFPPELISASCVEPEITLEDAVTIFTSPDWNGAELRKLFFAAMDANVETGDIPLSRTESEGTLNLLLSSLTQQSKESPTLSL